jgi:hypothetical protein
MDRRLFLSFMMLNSVFAHALKKNLAEHFVEHFLLLSAFIAHADQIAEVYYVISECTHTFF